MAVADQYLTAEQRQAIAKADAVIGPALQLYEERTKLMRVICRLPMRDLVRLNALIARLSDDDLRHVAAYAEGMAEWGGA